MSELRITRRAALGLAIAGGAVLGVALSAAGVFRGALGLLGRSMPASGTGMMGNATSGDMSGYMELFNRHREIRRSVEEVPGGVRTLTESDAADLVTQLQAHVSSMYTHIDDGAEVTCMSNSLPTLFKNAKDYRRELLFTDRGVSVTETSSDTELTEAIRKHAREVSGFVRDGMPAMMRGMMDG